jgi:hypothetical protein
VPPNSVIRSRKPRCPNSTPNRRNAQTPNCIRRMPRRLRISSTSTRSLRSFWRSRKTQRSSSVAMVLNGYPGRNDRSPGPQTLPVFTLGRPDLFLSPRGRWRIASQRDAYKSLSAANPGSQPLDRQANVSTCSMTAIGTSATYNASLQAKRSGKRFRCRKAEGQARCLPL